MTRDVGGVAISTKLLPRKSQAKQRKPGILPRIEFHDLSRRMTKPTNDLCAEGRPRSASAQPDQSLRCAFSG